jgi:UDP-2-acetamido-2,6-beta-L-arabino-hexul-4-ose reductase
VNQSTIGITGAGGFIGSHLKARVGRQEGWSLRACRRDTFEDAAELREFVAAADAIVHLAGMNRGEDREVAAANTSLAQKLVAALDQSGERPHLIYASSTQETADNAYGRSKRAAGRILAQWACRAGAPLTTLVIPNVYGAGCRPFYNSVVATFCHQLARGQQPQVHVDKQVEFIYVDELADEILRHIQQPPRELQRVRVEGTARMSVSTLLSTLQSFRDAYFDAGVVPELSSPAQRNLYATFLSYVEPDNLRHRPTLHTDQRGSLVEVIKLAQGGQVFFSTTKPGVIRGDHYHTRKIEWFCVLRGEAVIRLRRVGTGEIKEFRVRGDEPQFISIPVFHTHNIENVGDDELLTMFWCNEIFDQKNPDTYFEKVA